MTDQDESPWTSLRHHWNEASKKETDYRSETEKATLQDMLAAFQRLTDEGWREACYCPKDGSLFLSISAGSTGVFPCRYQGEWPTGSYWAEAHGDLWPAHPILFKPMPKDKP